MEFSQENNTDCLKIIDGEVKAFSQNLKLFDDICIKIPHMGWNRVMLSGRHPVFEGIQKKDEFYFVHGFYPVPDEKKHVLGITSYGINFASVIAYKNLIATQFHLEKSGRPGLRILKNFCRWNPC
jgi:glutamine amidotransferase